MTVCETCKAIGGLHKYWCSELAASKADNAALSIGIESPDADHPVHHPNHYTAYKGLEVIDLTEQMNFNRGNAVKYIARAGIKDKAKEIEDLQKAAWYINREIERLENEAGVHPSN